MTGRHDTANTSGVLQNRHGRFALVPDGVLECNPNAVVLWCHLWHFAGNGSHAAWPSLERLVDDTGMSRSTVQRALRDLYRVGAVTKTNRTGTSCLYELNWVQGGVDNQGGEVTGDHRTQVTGDLPPRSLVTYKERQSELEKRACEDLVTGDHPPGEHVWGIEERQHTRNRGHVRRIWQQAKQQATEP